MAGEREGGGASYALIKEAHLIGEGKVGVSLGGCSQMALGCCHFGPEARHFGCQGRRRRRGIAATELVKGGGGLRAHLAAAAAATAIAAAIAVATAAEAVNVAGLVTLAAVEVLLLLFQGL